MLRKELLGDEDEHMPNHSLLRGRCLATCLIAYVILFFASLANANGLPSRSQIKAGEDEPSEVLSESEWKRGYHGLSILCQAQDLSVVDMDEWESTDPNQSILVVLGDVSRLRGSLRRYLNDGGAVLVASDRGSANKLSTIGLRIYDGPVTAHSNRDAYRGEDDCVIIRNLSTSHPTTEGVGRLVTNRPGLMGASLASNRLNVRNYGVLARYPAFVFNGRVQMRPFNNVVFGWHTETVQGGRLIVVADQSMFSNQMLVHGDNALFLQQTLSWLSGNSRTSRSRDKVLILAGEPLPALDPSSVAIVPPPPDPSDVAKALQNLPPEVLLEFANSVVATVQEDGIMNEMLRDSFRSQPPYVIRRWLLVIPAVIVAGLLLWRLVTGSNTNDRERASTSMIGEAYESDSADAGYERFLAAHELVCAFQNTLARVDGRRTGGATEDSPGLRRMPRRYQREYRSLTKELRRFRRDYWTEKRLIQIEQQVSQWQDSLSSELEQKLGATGASASVS